MEKDTQHAMYEQPLRWINDGRHNTDIALFIIESARTIDSVVDQASKKLHTLTHGKYESFAAAVEDPRREVLTAAVEAIYLQLREARLRYEHELHFDAATGAQEVQS